MHRRLVELHDYLDVQRRALRAAVDGVLPADRERKPHPGAWSVAGVVEHLAIVERRIASVFAERVARARAEGIGPESATTSVLPTIDMSAVLNRSVRVTASEAAQPTGLGAERAWCELERSSQALWDAIATGDGLDLAAVRHPHPALGPLSLYERLAFVGAHEARHAEQIRNTGAELRERP